MNFQETKRKGLDPSNLDLSQIDKVSPIDIESMELKFGLLIARFKRLKYKGCPKIHRSVSGRDFSPKVELIEMDRDPFIRQMYDIFKGFSSHSPVGYARFAFLARYVEYLDQNGFEANLTESNVFAYFKFQESQVLRGKYNKNSLQKDKTHFVAILHASGDSVLARKFPQIIDRRSAAIPTPALADSDYAAIARKLINAFVAYTECIFQDQPPEICPLFNSEEALNNGLSETKIRRSRSLAKTDKRPFWKNRVTEIAIMITSLWTGANLTPLLSLRRSDVQKFKKCGVDQYVFDSVKARALYEKDELGIGFTKRSKEFFENWLLVSEMIDPRSEAMLFPYLDIKGNLIDPLLGFALPHRKINPKLKAMGWPNITTKILRSTRSSTSTRAYSDIFVTAWINRNSVNVSLKHYLAGNAAVHELQLAGAFSVQKAVTEGVAKEEAIKEYMAKFQDPFTHKEWIDRKNNALATKTPTGVRCTSPFSEKAEKSLRPFRELESSKTGACIDFLECFECTHHALIAEVDDIWLMLSFLDTLEEVMSRPSYESFPSEHFAKIKLMTLSILEKMREKSPDHYFEAQRKNGEMPHPLYSDEDSIHDLLEVYK